MTGRVHSRPRMAGGTRSPLTSSEDHRRGPVDAKRLN